MLRVSYSPVKWLAAIPILLIMMLLSATGFSQQALPASASPASPVSPSSVSEKPIQPSISLSPAVIMARGSFGQGLSQTLTLSNQTSHDFAFEMVANDVVIKNGKREFVAAGQLPKSIAATAVFSQPTGVVKAYGSITVEVRVTVPEATDIRAIVAIFRGTENLAQKSSVGMTASLGALLTFNLTDNVNVEGTALEVLPPSATSGLRVSQSLENKGSEPVLPQGVAAFLDGEGKLSAKLTFAPQRLLPGEKLDFTADYAGDLRPGAYKVLCSFEYAGKTLTTESTYNAE
jgi:hypothetical protein